jgi:hypothetical protein
VIHGWCTLRRLFGPGRRQSWAIGTLPRPLARAVLEGCVAPGIPVAAELVAISDRDGGLPIVSVAVLVPAAHRAVLGREPAPGRAKLRSV